MVDVGPPPEQQSADVELGGGGGSGGGGSSSDVRVHDDRDVEAPRHGWLSQPCDCCLTLFAALADAIETGADQLVGMVLLPLVGGLYYVLVLRPHSIAADGGADGRGRTSDAAFIVAAQPSTALAPSPPPDWSHQWQSASFRQIQLHPALFVAIDLGGLVVIFVLVLFEASLQRAYYEWRSRARGYQSLDPIDTPAPRGQVGGVGGAEENDERIKPVRMMRAATLRREMAKAVDASESLELQMRMQQRTSEDSIGEPATPPRKTANAAANGNAVDAATAAADATATTADATAKPLAAVVPTAADACASPIDGSHEGAALRHALRKQLARRSRLQTALQRNASFASSPERARQSVDNASWCARLASSTFVKVFRRSTNGLITVWLCAPHRTTLPSKRSALETSLPMAWHAPSCRGSPLPPPTVPPLP